MAEGNSPDTTPQISQSSPEASNGLASEENSGRWDFLKKPLNSLLRRGEASRQSLTARGSWIEGNESNTDKRWFVSSGVIIDSEHGVKTVDSNSTLRPVVDAEGHSLGEVLELTVEAGSGDKQANLDFRFKKSPNADIRVLTSGWQTWSSSVVVGKFTDQLVGMRSYQDSLGGATVPFFEPGTGNQKIPADEGRSYGWVAFRDTKAGENLALGVIPSFDSVESITFREEGDNIVVSVSKDLEGVNSQRNVTFKVFLGQGNSHQEVSASGKVNYADLLTAFSKELGQVKGLIPLMKDRVIGFSWAAHGFRINQDVIGKEIQAGKGTIDTYIIDAGWEQSSGSLTVDRNKFPDLPKLAQQMKEVGIKPGIWTCPFRVDAQAAKQLPKEWFMKDSRGNPKRLKMPMPVGLVEWTYQLDVSVPEVRDYLASRFTELAKMGFETFKVDFISVPFTGELQNKDKTSVEYYRQTFGDIRQRIRDGLGREIELIGCGAPMMESIGLFNGIRMTADSALPNLEGMPVIGTIVTLLNKIPRIFREYSKANTGMYLDTVAVAARRILMFKDALGLILDGVHITDKDMSMDTGVPMDPEKIGRLNKSLLALKNLGFSNLFVGDSLDRVGEKGRQGWKGFISQFIGY